MAVLVHQEGHLDVPQRTGLRLRVGRRLDEAVGLFEDVVANRLRVLRREQPDTLTARHHVA